MFDAWKCILPNSSFAELILAKAKYGSGEITSPRDNAIAISGGPRDNTLGRAKLNLQQLVVMNNSIC
jgi:hypothetical protein